MHKLCKVTQRTPFSNGCSSLHNGADLKLLAKFSQNTPDSGFGLHWLTYCLISAGSFLTNVPYRFRTLPLRQKCFPGLF